MRYFANILLVLSSILLVLIFISLVPFKSIPSKFLSKSKIKPLSILDYGYINLITQRYSIKNFSYIAKIDDKSYILVRANKLGFSFISDYDIHLDKCEIYLVTSHPNNEILNILTTNIASIKQDFSIGGSGCTIDIKATNNDSIQSLSNSAEITQDDILNIKYQYIIHGENSMFNLYKTDFIKNYLVKTTIDGVDTDIIIENDDIKNLVEFKFPDTKISYEVNKVHKVFSFNTTNMPNFIIENICTSQYCKSLADNIINKDIHIDATSPKDGNIWTGKVSGFLNATVMSNGDKISLHAKDMNLNIKQILTKDNNLLSIDVPIYDILVNYFTFTHNIDFTVDNLKLNDIPISNFKISYDGGRSEIDISGKYHDKSEIKTLNKDIKNMKININDILLPDILYLLYPDSDPSLILTKDAANILGDLTLETKYTPQSIYFSDVKYVFDKSILNLKSNECIADCSKEINISNIDLFNIFNHHKLLSIAKIDTIINTKSDITQSALIYNETPFSIDKKDTLNITGKDIKVCDYKIDLFEMNIQSTNGSTLLEVKDIKSDIADGSFNVSTSINGDKRNALSCQANFKTINFDKILSILYPNIDSALINIVLPSFIGFSGNFDIKLSDIQSSKLQQIDIKGNIENGKALFNDGIVKYNNVLYNTNGAISMLSKPIINVGIAINSPVNSILYNNLPFDGVYNVSGNLEFAGFSWRELQESISGDLTGKIYNFKIKNCYLQKLSNEFLNLKNIKNLDISQTISAGDVAFKEAVAQFKISGNKIVADISNAKNLGSSFSGNCTLNMKDGGIENCKAMFGIVGRDFSRPNTTMMLQMSWAGGGNIANPIYKYNYDQLNQYQQNAIKYVQSNA